MRFPLDFYCHKNVNLEQSKEARDIHEEDMRSLPNLLSANFQRVLSSVEQS
jgi:hypothetical protein